METMFWMSMFHKLKKKKKKSFSLVSQMDIFFTWFTDKRTTSLFSNISDFFLLFWLLAMYKK